MAWLLAVNRLLSPASAALGRVGFIRDMAEHGVHLDSSRVSRIEAGEYPIRTHVVDAYEQVIGLPSGSLQSANALLRRAAGLPPDAVKNASRGAPVIDCAAERIEGGVADGNDWLTLTRGLAGYEYFYLLPRTWTTLTDQLISELTRATGVAFHRRYEAALTLQGDPVGRRQLAMSIGRFVMHRDVQRVDPAMSLLQQMADPAAGDLVLRLMQDDNSLRRGGAARVVGSLAAGCGLDPAHHITLEHYLSKELGSAGRREHRVPAVDLLSRLPPASYARVLGNVADPQTRRWVSRACTSLELVEPDLSRSVVETLATGAEQSADRFADDSDRMLRRLLRESLFHIHRERRQLAAITLAASPYAPGIARSALRLTRGREPLVTAMCWSLLRRCGHLLPREHIAEVTLAGPAEQFTADAVMGLGLGHGPLPTGLPEHLLEAAREVSRPRVSHAATFTLGMAGHPLLASLSSTPGQAQAAARWWGSLGPALDDGVSA